MSVFRTILEVIGLFILLFILMPVLLALFGLMTGFWRGIYIATLNAYGPHNPLTMFTYYIYELSKWSSTVTRYGFNTGVNNTGVSNGITCA